MLRHLRRWEQGLPDESATNADPAPFNKLGSFPRWRIETAGLSAITDKLELFDRFGTLEDEIEPFLLRVGFVQRTPRGRVVTSAALHHLGIAIPEPPSQGTLF